MSEVDRNNFVSIPPLRSVTDWGGELPPDLVNPDSLGAKQELFAFLFPKLLDFAHSQGYRVRIGEVWRGDEQQKANIAKGSSKVGRSLHQDKLAVDLNLFKDSDFLETTEEHRPLGEFWESLHPLCRWGGEFGDGNHYSITHGGRR